MKTVTVTTDPQNQISSLLMDLLKPISLRESWDLDLKINYYIKPYIQIIKLITDLGEAEHSGDWDPSILITFHNGRPNLETDPGYYIMDIHNSDLILEDSFEQGIENNGGNSQHIIPFTEMDSYHIIPINEIHTIQIIRN